LSEVFFETALQRAAELDEHFKTHGRPIGPLHGLPISLKDQFRVNGLETSVGYIGWLGKKETAESESYLVKTLRDLGAVFYVKTNVPTSLMAIETNNNIIGYTWNAHNRLLSSGGSSGGEAALLAMRGSVLGLGSDVGASIRLPAAVSGLVGLKPSTGRLPYLRVANSMEGQETVSSVIGPMGRNPQDLQMLVRSILDSSPWMDDPKTLNMPWRVHEEDAVRTKAQRTGLTLGVMKYDGLVMPHPPVLRAIDECVASLKAQGHEVIEWKPPSHSKAFDILFKTFLADGGTDIHSVLSLVGEVPVPQLEVSYGKTLGSVPVSTLNEIWALQKRKDEYQTRYLQYWNSTAGLSRSGSPVDAVILPACPSASFKPGESMYFGYTGVANVPDHSTAVVPVTCVDAFIDVPNEKYSPSGDIDQKIWADCECISTIYSVLPPDIAVAMRHLLMQDLRHRSSPAFPWYTSGRPTNGQAVGRGADIGNGRGGDALLAKYTIQWCLRTYLGC